MPETHTLTLDEVEALALRCLTASGASALQAAPVARSIRDAEAEGLRVVGLAYLPWYCGHLQIGKIAGQAVPQVTRPRPGMVRVDAADGFAHPAFDAGEAALVQAAQGNGIALMGISNAYACGALGHFTARLARQGLIGLMFANASATMAPWGGRQAFFGTNPWSMAAPRAGEPLVLDSSSAATAYVNLATAAARGQPIPPDWALDADGNPTTDPSAALAGTIAPSGGHKGSALALMVEVLAAGLTGAMWSHEASSLGDDLGGPPRLGQTIIAIQPDAFGTADLAARIDGLAADMAAQPGVRVPGDRRHANRQRFTAEGVPVDAELIARLHALGART
jgi:(2R)-3-sulfolactate dehydrogenase (NADP+)